MNYSNMIEEKKLKKTFIIATLISTIIGTFTTGINLYDRVQDKRKQDRTDHRQDEKIRALKKRVEDVEEEKKHHQRRGDELRDSLQYGAPMIRQEYDRNMARLGPRFAEGDVITQTQLQGQIITLQGTVIELLRDALITGGTPDTNRLFNASEFAREGSIRALRDQYQRMLQAAPPQRPLGPVRRISSTPALRDGPAEPAHRSQDVVLFNRPGPLFCSYAEELQRTNRPLDEVFGGGGSGTCPACGMLIAVEPGRSWKIDKEVVEEMVSKGRGYDQEIVEIVEDRTYQLTNRFLIKCHREGAGYACYLCFRNRETDTLCKTEGAFVDHVSKKHSVTEYARDLDIREI